MTGTSLTRVRTIRRPLTLAGAPAAKLRFPLGLLAAAVSLLVVAALWAPAARAAEAGQLDLTFSQNGRVETSFSSSGSAYYLGAKAVAVQADGKIVAAGTWQQDGNSDFAVARYNTNGTLDTSFAGDGRLTTNFDGHSYDGANAVAVQPDGKIVVAGSSDGDFAAARYHTNGSLDTSFSNDGRFMTGYADGLEAAEAVAVQPDGKIVIAGWTDLNGSLDFAIARIDTGGTLDSPFSIRLTGFGSDEVAYAVAIQPDGKIVVAGQSNEDDADEFALARYTAGGSLDSSFDGDGRVETGISGARVGADAVAIQGNGRIVAAGWTIAGSDRDFELMRYNTDGTLDTKFDGNGKQATEFGGRDLAAAVAVQPDGSIVAAGWTSAGIEDSFDFALARYNRNGALDGFFGGGDGKVTTHWAGGDDYARAVAIQPGDGKIVAAGSVTTFNTAFALARYHAVAN
jgi:uncharacterized delta-60 repeat protein